MPGSSSGPPQGSRPPSRSRAGPGFQSGTSSRSSSSTRGPSKVQNYRIKKSKFGQGVFAVRDIAKGETSIEEIPLLVINTNNEKLMAKLCSKSFVNEVYRLFEQLSGEHQVNFRALSYSASSETISGWSQQINQEFKTGDMNVGMIPAIWNNKAFSDSSYLFMAKDAARLNHSCQIHAFWSVNPEKVSVQARTDIRKGEEIFITYTELCAPCDERRQRLQKYDFKCWCTAFNLNLPDSFQSEQRRTQLRDWMKKLGRPYDFTRLNGMTESQLNEHIAVCGKFLYEIVKEPTLLDEMTPRYGALFPTTKFNDYMP